MDLRPKQALQWATSMFGEVALDPRERTMRFVEEAIELAQAMGLDPETVLAIRDRVYSREQGLIRKEIGQCAMTLEVLAESIGMNANDEATREFARVQSIPREEWQRRHEAKQAIGIAQPS